MDESTQILAHDRNGDPVYSGTRMHANGSVKATHAVFQCDKYADCVELVPSSGMIEVKYRIQKRQFADTLWTVKPWSV